MGQQLWGCFKTPLWRAEERAQCDTGPCTPSEQQNSPACAASASQTSPVTRPRVAGTSQGNLHCYWSSRRKKLLWMAKGHRAAVPPPDFAGFPSCHLSFPQWDEQKRKLSTYLSFLIMCICFPWHCHRLEMQDFVRLCREVRWKTSAHSKHALWGHPTSSEGLCGSSIFPSHLKATSQPSTSRRRRFSSQNSMFLRHTLH